ncbi:MAG TPA: PrsW family glutamic-type intramembrane protease [Acidimicrobiales bacterium]|nr:PrsW family glutamic-type intramembrane protease [Acidimicrobiales bacterium]
MNPCPKCGRDTPDEPFCTWCGAQQAGGGVAGRGPRRREFAASAGEHVNQPAVVTTLLPHLPRHRAHEFRWALAGGVGAVAALLGGGLVVAAILAAAVLVPALYLVYLYEAQVYRDEPARVLGMTMAAGAVIGVAVSIVFRVVEPSTPTTASTFGYVLASTVLLPVVQEVLKPLPMLGLRRSAKFSETIDGLTFGVAAGLGFAIAETIVNYSSVIATEPVRAGTGDWFGIVIPITILTPLMQGSCTGILAAVLWRPGRLRAPLFAVGIPVAFAAHIVFRLGSYLLFDAGANGYVVIFFEAAIDAALLVYIRHVVHYALMEEAGDFGFQVVSCPHCRHEVGAAGFCPLCGGAISAGPRSALPATSTLAASAAGETPAGPLPGGAVAGTENG